VQPLLQCKSSITETECVFVALSVQQAMRMRYTVMWPAPPCNIFSHLINGTIFERKKTVSGHKMCFDFLYNVCVCVCETFLILRRNERDMIKNIYRSSCKLPFILVRFQ
jgi:hypothetical protein